MLTVIIAPEEYIETLQEYNLFLGVLLKRDDIALCKCDYTAKSIDTMAPDLYGIVANCKDWRAVIVAPDNRNKINPFDFTEYSEKGSTNSALDWDYFVQRRESRFECFEKAVENPLLKLSTALCGAAYSTSLMPENEFDDICSGKIKTYEYMLKKCMLSLNIPRIVFRLKKFGDEELVKLVGENNFNDLVISIEESNVDKIIDIVGIDKILRFNGWLSNFDPFYTDPAFLEEMIENKRKSQLLKPVENNFCFMDVRPSEVICVSLRTFDTQSYFNNRKKKLSVDSSYSRFSLYNLYPEKLRYLVFDILPKNDKRYEKDYIRFLSVLLVIAGYDLPKGTVSKECLYRIESKFDDNKFVEICKDQVNKLNATRAYLSDNIRKLSAKRKEPLDDKTAEELFESEIYIPVEIRSSHSKSDLEAKYNRIGLSNNCPVDESEYWDSQYFGINKAFVRYLREPRRAVKTAAKGEFKAKNKVEDERILQLSEYQLEDIVIKLEEEEQKMVETTTSHIYKTDEYNKKISKADKEIKNRINQRMSKKSAVSVGLIAGGAYLFGFIPLLLSDSNTIGSFSFSSIFTLVSVSLFLLAGFISLIVFRHSLIEKFKQFNVVMNGICQEINDSLSQFSKYFGHACNVMRKFAILGYSDESTRDKIKIMNKHKTDVEQLMERTARLYAGYVNANCGYEFVDPFDFNYSIMTDYNYESEYRDVENTIDFIQTGNSIKIPVDYLNSVMVFKEDLYD